MDLAISRSATAAVVGAVAATGLIAVTAPPDPAPLDLQVPAVQLSAATFDQVLGAVEGIFATGGNQIAAALTDLTSGDLAQALYTATAGSLNYLIAAPDTAFVGSLQVLLGENLYYWSYAGGPPPVDLGDVFADLQYSATHVFNLVSGGITELLAGNLGHGLTDLVWGLTGGVSFIPWDLFLGPLAVLLAMF